MTENSSGEVGAEPEHPSSAGTPRWVKVSALIALIVALVFVLLAVTGLGGEHGPGRHAVGGTETALARTATPTDIPTGP